jgi:hypothetical protein
MYTWVRNSSGETDLGTAFLSFKVNFAISFWPHFCSGTAIDQKQIKNEERIRGGQTLGRYFTQGSML